MPILSQFFAESQLSLLFATVLLGVVLGRLSLFGIRLGVAGVLFSGLLLSAFLSSDAHRLFLAREIKELGLLLFVYCVGLTSAPGFFAELRSQGLRQNGIAVLSLCISAGFVALTARLFSLSSGSAAGIFTGALTNTPALAAATDRLSRSESVVAVLSYSATYPLGVLLALLLLKLSWSRRQRDPAAPTQSMLPKSQTSIGSASCVITNPDRFDRTIVELDLSNTFGVTISRLKRDGKIVVANPYTRLHAGDVITIVGPRYDLARAILYFGEPSLERIEEERSAIDSRRILVSRRALAQQTVGELDIFKRFGAQITRLRRADFDMVPSDDTAILVGDRLRVVAPKERLAEIAQFFGDSERELAAVDFVSVSLGLLLGLWLGKLPIEIFGTELHLGLAGGPLLAALALGRLGRTGKIAWVIPYDTNVALREFGLMLFLAGVGISAGAEVERLLTWQGALLVGLGAVTTLLSLGTALALFERTGPGSSSYRLGLLSGIGTQPASLGYSYELSEKNNQVYVAYAVTYPVSMIAKILLVQGLIALT